jgi:hypothetical protein
MEKGRCRNLRTELSTVMAGHSRPKDGVAALAYVPAIHALLWGQGVDARDKRGHDERWVLAERTRGFVLAKRTRDVEQFQKQTRPDR